LDFGLLIEIKIGNPNFVLMELPEANWKERILFFLGRRKPFLVEGNSMLPALKAGDAVLINPQKTVAEGDIVLANHPYKKSVKILKRVKNFTEKGDLYLVGDNAAESTDSRTFGAVPLKYLIGKATCRLK
jgi:nickel-type superoxide dismutase maturation protease